MNPAAHRVPIKDPALHMDAIWRGMSYEEMIEFGKMAERGEVHVVVPPNDPESLI